MRKRVMTLVLLVGTIAFCTGARSQKDPFLGVWQLNLDKSPNYTQQGQTIINVPIPGGFNSIRATLNTDNTVRTEIHPVLFDGQFHQTQGSDIRGISYKRLNLNTIERTTNRNGKISVDKEEVSKDGKTLTVEQMGMIRVFDRQFNVVPIRH